MRFRRILFFRRDPIYPPKIGHFENFFFDLEIFLPIEVTEFAEIFWWVIVGTFEA